MLRKTEEDNIKVKMYCWSIDVFASVVSSNVTKKLRYSELEKKWDKNLKLKLKKY
jgi:hypothetical protein